MIKFFPSFNNILENFKSLAGNQSGILEAACMPVVNFNSDVSLKSITGNMPDYHKQVFNKDVSMQYHIMGYGSHYEEALIKYTGESIERYSSIMGPTLLKDKIVYESYKELSKNNKVMPLKYIDVFTENQIKKAKELNVSICDKKVEEDDIIGWIKCPSLLKKSEEIYVPAKMIFVGYEEDKNKGEMTFIPSFSTGTAAHKSLKKALLNALIEYIQIDSFMINWHTKGKCSLVKIDDENVLKVLEDVNLGEKSPYEIIPLYMSLEECPIHNFGVFLRRKDNKLPYLLFGVQGGMDASHALTRGIMEAASISYGAYFNAIYNKDMLNNVIKDDHKFLDLDSNVLYYSLPNKIEEKNKLIEDFIGDEITLSSLNKLNIKEIDKQIKTLLNYLKDISEYAVYLDLTPPETRDKGWYVMRVMIPELIEMCIPEFSFENHPRMKKYGGVINEYPHPMP
ncbi:thiazole/oxazole-forming peptide maturase SagD [Clostridium sporogenes]|uniref:YcaO-like family protein n=1 Tax=Clostridium botulinum TaxID=1491 RepID=UPI0007179F25|nr:YcaO-like family protein [Clostridium botulinum]KRU24278.1 thiazole/oxazole-forming peptide maturase SagD [Clostridium sporogenes]KRU26131.1 thiazole/oxazole-forming peptide maturase SagD [Clostridium sporogenes]KRU27187.1 thiazole/oxazole-forming peptide maturase SagD [Clostridium sporogenes]KRU49047.1 thiazole/oxazole-forming peptide maturase SagD [Clostridium sporogenes]MBZ1328717.1 YcaO-like family protein [Clostridium botulinum]